MKKLLSILLFTLSLNSQAMLVDPVSDLTHVKDHHVAAFFSSVSIALLPTGIIIDTADGMSDDQLEEALVAAIELEEVDTMEVLAEILAERKGVDISEVLVD